MVLLLLSLFGIVFAQRECPDNILNSLPGCVVSKLVVWVSRAKFSSFLVFEAGNVSATVHISAISLLTLSVGV